MICICLMFLEMCRSVVQHVSNLCFELRFRIEVATFVVLFEISLQRELFNRVYTVRFRFAFATCVLALSLQIPLSNLVCNYSCRKVAH